MIRFEQKIKNALTVINEYSGKEPLHHFLATFYKHNKKMGSTDRRFCSQIVYVYFRLGNALSQLTINEKIIASAFLFTDIELSTEEFENNYSWIHIKKLSFKKKMELFKHNYIDFSETQIFPNYNQLSELINKENLLSSIYVQPLTFIRVSEKNTPIAIEYLNKTNVPFLLFSETCIGFEPRLNLQTIIGDLFPYEVQDLSSQQTQMFMNTKANEQWLDCCAGSGGKSLLLYENEKSVRITACDIRSTSIENLNKRFKENGISKYTSFKHNATQKFEALSNESFDGIIADVPCTGSGTWARTPENLVFFEEKKIKEFSSLQFEIVKNIIDYLKPSKTFLYITCSVFAEENERVVDKIKETLPMNLIEMKYLEGAKNRADTMFCALFTKH